MRRLAFVLVIPLLLPPGPAGLRAQEESDARWLAECDEYGSDDHATFCDVVVESIASPAATIAFDGGRNGGVAYYGWDRDEMEVHARIQAHGDTEAEARERARAVRFELGPGGGRAIGPDKGAVVFHVYVPRRVNLEGIANNGPLSVEGVHGRIRLETRNGPIDLEDVGGDVVARARNGPLSVTLTGSTWQGEKLDAETRNGPISLSIPAGYAAILETGTDNGPFSTEIPLQVQLQPGQTPRRFQAVLGGGGPLVRVVTTNGPAKIRGR